VSSIGRGAPVEFPAPETVEAVLNVRTFGAIGDGKTVDTPAINRAIEAIFTAGGGTLFFPAVTYMCFTVRLRSNVDLYLSRGCVILAADSPKPGEATGYNGGAYNPAGPTQAWEAYQDYGHNHWSNSLFYGEGLSNLSIFGPGLIHGRGLSYGQGAHVDAKPDPLRGPGAQFRAEQAGVANKAIGLKKCHDVILRDFSILKGGHFAVLATGVDNLTIDNLLIDTDRDGLDIDCCRNVRVTNCTVNSPWDDAICPKSSYALGYPRPTENVTVSNCFVTGTYQLGIVIDGSWKKFADDAPVLRQGRIKCGTESNGGFRNIALTNNLFEGCKGIGLESSDGALIEDIAISNITMRDIVDAPLFLGLNRRNRGPKEAARPGTLQRVLISNIVSHNSGASTSSLLVGIPENLIEDVKVANCYFGHQGLPKTARVGFGETSKPMPDWRTISVSEIEDAYPETLFFGPTPCHGLFARHLKNLEMSHVEIAPANPDPRPAFWLEDVHRANFLAITAPPQPNFELRNIIDLRITWSRAAKDTTIPSAANELI
jgi:polygalacturonase